MIVIAQKTGNEQHEMKQNCYRLDPLWTQADFAIQMVNY